MDTAYYKAMHTLLKGLETDPVIEAIKDCPWQVFDNKDNTVMWNVDALNKAARTGEFGDAFRTTAPGPETINWDNMYRPYVYSLIDDMVLAKIIHGHPLYAFDPIIVLGGTRREDGAMEIVDILDGNHRLAAIVHAGVKEFICWMVPAEKEQQYRVEPIWAQVLRACSRVLESTDNIQAFDQAFDAWKASRGLTS